LEQNKANTIDESTREQDKLDQSIAQLNRLERLGTNRDSTRVPPPEMTVGSQSHSPSFLAHQHGQIKDGREMTLLEVTFRCGEQPDEDQTRAIGRVREVYGIRRVAFNEKERTLRIEYDASRLSESVVAGLLRSAGIDCAMNSFSTGADIHST
jgi:hypothetical protein